MDFKTKLLLNILDCGTEELVALSIMNDNFDVNSIITELLGSGDRPTFNAIIENLCYQMIEKLNNTINEFADNEDFFGLNAYADFEFDMNGISASVNCINNQDIYEKYFDDVINDFNTKVGFTLFYVEE